MANKFEADADAFRFYVDDGDEAGSTAAAPQDTNIEIDISDLAQSDIVQLRYRVQEVGDGDIDGGTTDDYTLEFQKNGGGGWEAVDTGTEREATSYAAGPLTDQGDTTDRSTDGISAGSGSFATGGQSGGSGADGEVTDRQLTGNDYTEHVWTIFLSNDTTFSTWDDSSTDFVEFRMRYNGGGMTNSVTPRITRKTFRPRADAFRFYEDGTESGSSAIAAQDVDLTSRSVDSDSQVHLRWRVQNLAAVAGATADDYHCFASINSGAFFQVTTSTSNVKGDTSSGLSDTTVTTNRSLPDGIADGTGSFVAGEQSESGTIDDRQLTASNYTEHVYAVVLISADLSDTDTIDFQMRGPTNGPFDQITTAAATARITVSKGGAALQDIIMGPGIIPFAR